MIKQPAQNATSSESKVGCYLLSEIAQSTGHLAVIEKQIPSLALPAYHLRR